MLGRKPNRSRLLDQARQETITMLEKAQQIFGIAWATLTEGGPDNLISKLDHDINAGERLVRRLVIEHLTLNPEQDLPSSLTLVSIIHDVERLGDYAKSIVELRQWSSDELAMDGLGGQCREIQGEIEPMFQMAIDGIRDDDEAKAADLMARHREVKAKSDAITEASLAGGSDHPDVLPALASRYLRRISAHLSNVVSSIVNPFDLISRND
jgi:phosphate transport system protein